MAKPQWLIVYKKMTKRQLLVEVARINRESYVPSRIDKLAHLYHEIVLRGYK